MITKTFKMHTKDFLSAMHFMYGVGSIINDYSKESKGGFEIKAKINPEAEFVEFALSPLKESDRT